MIRDIQKLRARDIMHTDVIKVDRNMTLRELATLFTAQHITGAPVVEAGEKLIGVVSETDLVRDEAACAEKSGDNTRAHPFFKQTGDGSEYEEFNFDYEEIPIRNDERTVEDIMTPWTITVDENTLVTGVAATMVKQHVHRVLVTDQRFHLKGIITSMDVARVVADMAS